MSDQTGGSLPLARYLRIRWRPRVAQEFGETFPILPDEREVLRGMVSARRLAISGGPALVLLTDTRLCVLDHFFFKPDRGIECPRGSIVTIATTKVLPGISYFRACFRTSLGIRAFDFGRVSGMTPAVAAIGVEPVSPQSLVDRLQLAWSEDAPQMLGV